MRKSHPAVSSPGLFASPWPPVLPWRRGPETIKCKQQARQLSRPGQHCTLHERGKGLQHDPICTDLERPCRQTRAGVPSAISNLFAPRSSHGRPTVVPRSAIGVDNCADIAPLPSPRQQNVCRARRPSAHSTCIRLGIVPLSTPVQHKALLGYLQATSQGTDRGHLLLIPLLRTPTEPTMSYHILCPSRVIHHPRTSRPVLLIATSLQASAAPATTAVPQNWQAGRLQPATGREVKGQWCK